MKIYYVRWNIQEQNNSLQGLSSLTYGTLGSLSQPTYSVKGKYFLNKEKAQTLCDNINEAAKLLQQFASAATVSELEVEE
jgi:hypothetical protein